MKYRMSIICTPKAKDKEKRAWVEDIDTVYDETKIIKKEEKKE